jgi:hypothetical protein
MERFEVELRFIPTTSRENQTGLVNFFPVAFSTEQSFL